MTSDELNKYHRVQFKLNRKLIQGLVVGDKRRKIVVMRHYGGADWRPFFIPIELLTHVNFHLASKPFMPIYNPIMEGILEEARAGHTDSC